MRKNTTILKNTKTVATGVGKRRLLSDDGGDNNLATKSNQEKLDEIFKDLKPLIKSRVDKVIAIDAINLSAHYLKLFHQLFKNEITTRDIADLSRLIDSDDRYAPYSGVKARRKSSRKIKSIPHGARPLFSKIELEQLLSIRQDD